MKLFVKTCRKTIDKIGMPTALQKRVEIFG